MNKELFKELKPLQRIEYLLEKQNYSSFAQTGLLFSMIFGVMIVIYTTSNEFTLGGIFILLALFFFALLGSFFVVKRDIKKLNQEFIQIATENIKGRKK